MTTTGKLFILSGPAGSGKNTLAERLLRECPWIEESISYTTRAKRTKEKEKHHYHFVSHQEFKSIIHQQAFIEYVELFGHFYGTPKFWLEERLQQGKTTLLIIDVLGAQKVRSQLASISIFIAPPSLSDLEKRLHNRRSESHTMIHQRIERAKEELNHVEEYDFLIVNDDFEESYQKLRAIFLAESCRQKNDLTIKSLLGG